MSVSRVLPIIAGQFRLVPRSCLGPQAREADSRAWGSYFAEPNRNRPLRRNLVFEVCGVATLAAQTYHYIDADNLVTIRWHRSFADDHIDRSDIHELVPILDVEVMMFGIVGVEVGLRALDRNLPQQADVGDACDGWQASRRYSPAIPGVRTRVAVVEPGARRLEDRRLAARARYPAPAVGLPPWYRFATNGLLLRYIAGGGERYTN